MTFNLGVRQGDAPAKGSGGDRTPRGVIGAGPSRGFEAAREAACLPSTGADCRLIQGSSKPRGHTMDPAVQAGGYELSLGLTRTCSKRQRQVSFVRCSAARVADIV